MKNKDIKDIIATIAEYDAPNHRCCRCGRDYEDVKYATMYKYGAFFCSEECAERVSDYTLEDGQACVPEYTTDLNAIQAVIMPMSDGIRDLYNDNLREDLCTGTPESELDDIDRLINATAKERATSLARTLKSLKRKKHVSS